MLLLPLLLLSAPPTADEARQLTSIVAAALADGADGARVDVVTKEDLRKAVDLQADRDAAGCSAESCLAEVAAALGASVVFFGSVGTFDDQLLLELAVFDADAATSEGRSIVRAKTLSELSTQAEQKTQELRSRALQKRPEGKLRVLVLDLELRNAAATTTTPPPAAGPSLLLIGGIGAGAVALLAGVGGGIADAITVSKINEANREVDGKLVVDTATAKRLYGDAESTRTAAVVGYAVAGVAVVAAGAMIGASFFLE